MIDKNSEKPVYRQLEETIEKDIYNGVFKSGDMLPSENEYCKRFNVSRTTVRQALNSLTAKGLLYSVHGKGTFVKSPQIRQQLGRIVDFGTSLKLKGLDGYTVIYGYSAKAEDKHASEILDGDYFNLTLMGYANDTPAVYYNSYIISPIRDAVFMEAKKLELGHNAFSSFDLYHSIGIRIKRVEQVIRAAVADKELVSVFGTGCPQAFMVLSSVYFDTDDRPLEVKTAFYRADMYSFELNREIEADGDYT